LAAHRGPSLPSTIARLSSCVCVIVYCSDERLRGFGCLHWPVSHSQRTNCCHRRHPYTARRHFSRGISIQSHLSINLSVYTLNEKSQSNLGKAASPPSQQKITTPQLQWDVPHLPPKLPLPLRRSPPDVIHPSLDRHLLPPRTASGSNQPFCHNTLSGHTDVQTDRWYRR